MNSTGGQYESDDEAIEEFIDTVVEEQNSDRDGEKEYLGYIRWLFHNESPYDIFSRMHHEYTCEDVTLRVLSFGPVTKLYKESPTDEIYHNAEYGVVLRLNPSTEYFMQCIRAAVNHSICISLSYEMHANMIWIDNHNLTIDRYDPQESADKPEQRIIDAGLSEFFNHILPDFHYLGNTLPDNLCVQAVRERGRKNSDFFCQDYSLLYAERRAKGMSHTEAAQYLVNHANDMVPMVTELMRELVYRKRYELGKPIPSQYQKIVA